jgi:hypothetical protein
MRSKLVLGFVIAAAAATAAAAAPGIRQVMGSTSDRAVPVTTALGESYASAREMRVDLDFPSGKSGKGTLFIIFEPSTGYFFRIFRWDGSDYPPASQSGDFVAGSWLGASTERLLIFTNGNPWLVIHESSEKAASLSEAEASSLKWAAGHLAEIEARKNEYRTASMDLRFLHDLPGFLPDEPQAAGGLPIKVIGIAPADKRWEVTIQGRWTAKVRVDDNYGVWGFSGYTRIDEPQEKK